MNFSSSSDAAVFRGLPDRDAAPRRLDIRFTGSGSEYLRIWLVNLLLTLLTLTLYAPFAKRRRLRWVHANTLVDGQALAFHGDPWKMLRGHLLILVFAGCYLAAGRWSAMAVVAASVALVLLWPALWQASLRFRLVNTSWRGLRFRFSGSLGGAYLALAPMLLPAALFLAAMVWPQQQGEQPPWVLGLAPMLVGLLWPWMTSRAKHYQHGHCHWAGQHSQMQAGIGPFYRLSMRAGMWTLIPLLLLGLLAAVMLPAFALGGRDGPGMGALLVLLLLVAGYFVAVVFGQAYLMAGLQNLVWGHTRSQALRFHSALSAQALWPRLAKNLLLTALTLGLYWPFGWVQLLRLRLEAVHIDSEVDPANWVASQAGTEGSAVGDAAADLLDIDLGL